jgi:hypothetical protein
LDTYTAEDCARFRAVLFAYCGENSISSMSELFMRLCAADRSSPDSIGLSSRTFRRFMAGSHETSKKAIAVIARFARGLPNRPDAFHALGEALHALYKVPLPPDIAGSYNLVPRNLSTQITQISISTPSDGFARVAEKHTDPISRFHDGVLVSTAPVEYLILLRDRLMLSPRYIATHGDAASVYDHARRLYPGDLAWNYNAVFTRAQE